MTVVNVAPSNVQINPIAPIDENGVAVLKLTFDDPGTLDSHTVEVDWGDGTVETIAVAAGRGRSPPIINISMTIRPERRPTTTR